MSKDRRSKPNNPYQILLLAVPFILGGILLLLQTGSAAIEINPLSPSGKFEAPGLYQEAVSASMQHWLGAIGVLVGAGILGFYFYVRGQIGKNSP
jgi:hypothetical protein